MEIDMTQNTSHAVMAQRHEPVDSLDDFPTPPWATRALCQHILMMSPNQKMWDCWEPACNRGHMSKVLKEYFEEVHSTDIHHYGYGGVYDFLQCAPYSNFAWIITNPPFRLGAEFIEQAHRHARRGVAMLVRTSFLEGGDRYKRLYKSRPPSTVAQFVERVPMIKGRLDKKASTATSYCWLIWDKLSQSKHTDLVWIPPCRKMLEKDTDYE
jgi:hypothetical protein